MSPASTATVRYALRQHTHAQCQAMAAAALAATDASTARAAVGDLLAPHTRDTLL